MLTKRMLVTTMVVCLAGAVAVPAASAGSGGGDKEGGRYQDCIEAGSRDVCVAVLEARCTLGFAVSGIGTCLLIGFGDASAA